MPVELFSRLDLELLDSSAASVTLRQDPRPQWCPRHILQLSFHCQRSLFFLIFQSCNSPYLLCANALIYFVYSHCNCKRISLGCLRFVVVDYLVKFPIIPATIGITVSMMNAGKKQIPKGSTLLTATALMRFNFCISIVVRNMTSKSASWS